MTTLRLIDSESASQAMTKLRLLKGESVGTLLGSKLRILNGTSVQPAAGTKLRVLNSTAANQSTNQASLAGPAEALPLDLVVLDASSSVGTITSIAQVSGPTVTLSGTGASRTFTAPVVFSSTGTVSDLVFRVTVSGGDTADWHITLYPHSEWVVKPDASGWVPRLRYGRDPATLLPSTAEGWGAQTFGLDFTTPVPLGGFVADSSGELIGSLGGTTAWQAYAASLNVDYTTAQMALSVPQDGYLDIWLRAGLICGVRPKIPGQVYGRYAFRFKAVSVLPGWTMRVGLLPADGILPNHGQIDFKGDLSSDILAAYTQASPSGAPVETVIGTAWDDDWHIGVLEWRTASLKLFIDGGEVWQSSVNVPSTPMLFSIRPTGSSGTDAHFHLDWVAAWSA